MFFTREPAFIARSRELDAPPPEGTPASVPIPGTELPGRTPIYRAWTAQKESVSNLEPEVSSTPQLYLPKVAENKGGPGGADRGKCR